MYTLDFIRYQSLHYLCLIRIPGRLIFHLTKFADSTIQGFQTLADVSLSTLLYDIILCFFL